MNQSSIDELKSQLEQIQEAIGALSERDTDDTDGADSADGADGADGALGSEEPVESDAEPEADGSLTRIVSVARGLVPRGRRALAAVVAVVLALVGAGTGYLLTRTDTLPGNAAYRVFGHDVTVDDLSHEIDTLTALYGVQPPSDPAKLATFRRDVAKATAVSRILDHAAAQRNIVIADKAAQDVLTRYITQQFGSGPDAHSSFVQALGSVGTSEAAVLTEIKRQMALSRLYDQVTAGVSVSAADLRTAFTKDHASLDTPETRDVRNIVVATKQQALAVLARLKAGTSFATLARNQSLDGSTRAKGGDLGQVAAADLDTDYAKAAFAAPAGGLFGPVQTDHGWNVGQVVSIVPSKPAVFDKVKDTLKAQVLTQRELVVWRSWLTKQIRSAHVRYADKYRPADPNAAPSSVPNQFGSASPPAK